MICMYVGIVRTAAAEVVVTTTPRDSWWPCSMSTSEERASKKAKIVDNESVTSKYCTYGHECSSRTC